MDIRLQIETFKETDINTNMKSNLMIKYAIGAVMVIAAVIFVRTYTGSVVYSSNGADSGVSISIDETKSASSAPAKPVQKPPGYYPSRLTIPSLGVNASVQYTGVTARGTIGTPTNYTDVAWYGSSAVPGRNGMAIIDGHVDNGLGLAGVFRDLVNIKDGDDIYVQDYNGAKHHFIVTSVNLYDYKSVPPEVLTVTGDKPRLELITCDGSWVPGDKTYDQRLIVTADLAT